MEINDKVKKIVDKGAELTGSAIGAAIAFYAGGPLSAAAFGVVGTVVSQTLTEVANRTLSNREEVRVGATAQQAITIIELSKSMGKKIRNDDFFSGDVRSDAEEVFEGCLLASKNTHEEKKSIYLGNLFANICFRDDIDKHQSNRLIHIAEQLSYSQLCLINIFMNKQEYNLRQGNFRNIKTTFKQVVLLQEIYAMEQSGIMIIKDQHTPGITDVVPSRALVQGVGVALYDLMLLSSISKDECMDIAKHLSR
ncbi:hypothetical protein [Vibrio parahaemolyticus]|uniref:hypothetical protein n=1 Tax=Vibrio parahaemolyticus TaxID=670 RepID=UPI000425E60D|nr:hypothetical protein [Vibrio parahaemolyticus]